MEIFFSESKPFFVYRAMKRNVVFLASVFLGCYILPRRHVFGQNIGVNTDGSSPSTLFHTKNTIAAQNNYLRIENTQGGQQSALQLLNSGTANADWIQYIPGGTTDFRFYRGSDLLTLKANGYVGFGTTAPNNRLQLSSDNSSQAMQFNTSGYMSANTWGTRLYKSDIGGGIPLKFETQSSAVWYGSADFDHGQDNGHPALKTYYNTQLAVTSGNVGIGTTNPIEKLQVNGNIKLDDNMMIEGNSAFRTYRNLATYNLSSSSATGAFAINTTIPWNSAYMFTATLKGYFYDATAPFEVTLGAYIYTDNNFYNKGYTNVGANKLSIRLGRNSGSNTVAIIIGNEGSTYSYPKITVSELRLGHSAPNDNYADGWAISQITTLTGYDYIVSLPDVTTIPAGSGNYIQNQTASDQSAGFRITGNGLFNGGNVGIGSLSPGYKLDVYGASGVSPAKVGSPDGYLVFGPANSGWCHFTTDRARFYFNTGGTFDSGNIGSYDEDLSLQTAGSTRMSILNSNGNVGIGTTNPGAKLHVEGSTYIPLGQSYWIGSTSDAGNRLRVHASGGYAYIDYYDKLYFRTGVAGSSTMVTFQSDGNVGIGTTNPAQKLEVSGRIKSNGVNETSDIRYKKNITPISSALEKTLALTGVNFYWEKEEFPEKNFDGKLQMGLIAQEVEKIIPEVVITDPDGYKSVEYSKIVGLLIEAIREQQKTISDLKKEHQTAFVNMQREIALLKADYEQLISATGLSGSGQLLNYKK